MADEIDGDRLETRGRTVTLHDVAAAAGVSIATVSRALNGLAVSKDALEKVGRAADQLGYVANEAARSLRSDRSMTMGLIFRRLDSSVGLEMLDALTAVVESAGYSLFVSTARGDDGRYDTLMRRFLERRVDAVFCAHPGGEGALLARYQAAGAPVATLFGRSAAYEGLPNLYPTVEGAADTAVRRLSSLGHRRVAVILGEAVRGPMIAVRQALKAFGMEIETRRLSEGPLDSAAWLAGWLAADARPTAVFADVADAVNLLRSARRMGIEIPRQLSVVAITDTGSRAGRLSRPPAAIQIDGAALGAAAARMMLDWLGGAAPPAVQKVAVGSWIERETIGPAPPDG